MESKQRANGVYRRRLAKEDYEGGSDDEEQERKPSSAAADEKPVAIKGHHRVDSKVDAFDRSQEKEVLREIQQDIEADDEYEELKNTPTIVAPAIAPTKFAKSFVRGFRIISMNMRDASTGRLLWRTSNWDENDMFEREIKEEIPKAVLKCSAVSREIEFSSTEELTGFRLEQKVYFRGNCIEEWFFKFGCVMAHSRNSWQQTIDAAAPEEMLSARALSGNVVFETLFYENDEFLCKNTVRIFYV